MRFYLLDDDINIIKILRNIVEMDFNREVVGFSCDPKVAIDEIYSKRPDVVLIDYLMPGLDGVDVIKKLKKQMSETYFVMLSQVSDKMMVADAYNAGISFFISKPINRIEVNAILMHLEVAINTTRKLKQIINLVGFEAEVKPAESINHILKDVGMYPEKGGKDIINIIELIKLNDLDSHEALSLYADKIGENSKIIRQRVRRAILKGIKNIAYLGIEDTMNEMFLKYANRLFDFECIKREMDHIRGLNYISSPIAIDKFIENLYEF